MLFLRRIPALLSALVLSAHFLRAGRPFLSAACLILPILFFVRTRFAVLASRAVLLAGTVLWIVTALRIAQARIAAGEPYLRMVLILGAVAALSALSAWLLPGPREETTS